MKAIPDYELVAYGNDEELPQEAEDLFVRQLAESRNSLPPDRPDCRSWRFVLICAVTKTGHVLGGIHLDIGPINGAGPIARKKLAYLERTFVREDYRGHGIATALLKHGIQVAAESDCDYIRCSNNWDNPAETALFRKSGFALVDLDGEDDEEPCYLAVRPVRNVVL